MKTQQVTINRNSLMRIKRPFEFDGAVRSSLVLSFIHTSDLRKNK
jgi:hypothetical protein